MIEPGAKAMTNVTGRCGQSCANDDFGDSANSAATKKAEKNPQGETLLCHPPSAAVTQR
jgi:hypothetical protein